VTNPRFVAGSKIQSAAEVLAWSSDDAAVWLDPHSTTIFPTWEITHDGGRTWAATGFEESLAFDLQRFDSDHLMFIAGDRRALATTADGGAHWHVVTLSFTLPVGRTSFLSVFEGWTLCPGYSGCDWGSTSAGGYTLYHTIDSGENWQAVSHGFATSAVTPDGLVFVDPNHGFISTDSKDGLGRLYVTDDGGTSWHLVTLPRHRSSGSGGGTECNPSEGCTGLPKMFGSRGVIVAGMPDGDFTYTTSDWGMTWTDSRPVPAHDCCLFTMQAADWNVWWMIGKAGAILKTFDAGGSWQQLQPSVPMLPQSPLCAEQSPPTMCYPMYLTSISAAGGNAMWGLASGFPGQSVPVRSVDGGATWSFVKLSDAKPLCVSLFTLECKAAA
jgi:hypothetical protein